jgi:hypothetical protein
MVLTYAFVSHHSDKSKFRENCNYLYNTLQVFTLNFFIFILFSYLSINILKIFLY